MRPIHTPYDGSAAPFSIGLKPLDPARWIEPDGDLDSYLAQKEQLYRDRPDIVFMAEPETRESQQEVLDALAEFLLAHFPDIYNREGRTIRIGPTGRFASLDAFPDAPLRTASMLVQEDLLVMRKGDDGWRLAAAALCFPSSWSLAEKFGRPLAQIHAPVPDFGNGTRNAELIERMFDRLQGQMVERHNWSLGPDPSLYLPLAEPERHRRDGSATARFPGDPLQSAYIRIERQTLRRMPVSGDVLFTIRIHVDPLGAIASRPDAALLASGLAAQLGHLDDRQLAYKGLLADRDRLLEALKRLARP